MQSKEFNRLPVEVQITGGGLTSLARGVWWSPRMLVSGLHIMSLTGEGLAPGQMMWGLHSYSQVKKSNKYSYIISIVRMYYRQLMPRKCKSAHPHAYIHIYIYKITKIGNITKKLFKEIYITVSELQLMILKRDIGCPFLSWYMLVISWYWWNVCNILWLKLFNGHVKQHFGLVKNSSVHNNQFRCMSL